MSLRTKLALILPYACPLLGNRPLAKQMEIDIINTKTHYGIEQKIYLSKSVSFRKYS